MSSQYFIQGSDVSCTIAFNKLESVNRDRQVVIQDQIQKLNIENYELQLWLIMNVFGRVKFPSFEHWGQLPPSLHPMLYGHGTA